MNEQLAIDINNSFVEIGLDAPFVFEFDSMVIHDPQVTSCTRFSVEPKKEYGDKYVQWAKDISSMPDPSFSPKGEMYPNVSYTVSKVIFGTGRPRHDFFKVRPAAGCLPISVSIAALLDDFYLTNTDSAQRS